MNAFKEEHTPTGIYEILLNTALSLSFPSPCPYSASTPDWVVIQRRIDGSVDFYRTYVEYETGFGDPIGNFWLGLRAIHQLCGATCELHIYLETFDGDSAFALYSNFQVGSPASKYRLLISGYSGTAGDGLGPHNTAEFTTKDNDNDISDANCAQTYVGGWWFTECHYSHLNGEYLQGDHDETGKGINWHYYRGGFYSYKTSVMKIRQMTD